MKPPFPSAEKRFKNIEAPIQAVDGSAEARIAALKMQRSVDYAFKLELVSTIRGMQAKEEQLTARVDQAQRERDECKHMGFELRRELFQARQEIAEQASGFVEQVAAKVKVVEGWIVQPQGREGLVEKKF